MEPESDRPIPRSIVLATGNPHKAREFEALMAGIQVEAMPDDIQLPPETGDTFYENARLKARTVHEALAGRAGGQPPWVMADDSGIEVEALGWGPGIYSSRYAGEDAGDTDNVEKLLAELEGARSRRARFVCVIVGIAPDGRELRAEGVFPGEIAGEPTGRGGFGYDPVFIPEGYSLTVSLLSAEEKNRISHRARAARSLLDQLRGGDSE
ncbi:MAG TPA: RdgB/HAM1 family non-canonical purine NTP pyrophosphatase [Actinobacteria bacterium]|nr:RdgB/HAM1 family non-canonical purine NTP pyrophosphatase [Actinomycetota bacterium]